MRAPNADVHSVAPVLAASTISPTAVLSAGVLAFVGFRLISGARYSLSGEGRRLVGRIVGGMRWRHVWPAPFVLTLVVIVASILMLVPGLDWGWWTALGGVGNPVTGGTGETAGTALEWLIPLLFVALLVPALPLFAYAEERWFRMGAEQWSRRRRVTTTIRFGLIHALIGIPLGAALALSVGGAYFLWVYLRAARAGHSPTEAAIESARAHTAYNSIILVLVAVVAVATAFEI